MPNIPDLVTTGPLMRGQLPRSVQDYLEGLGFVRVHQGKVRDTYVLTDNPDELIVVATNRLSIFDHVLPVEVDRKGEVLTALTHFWLTNVLADVPNHLMSLQLFPDNFPRERCLRVKKVKIQPFELIFRGHIGGSVWKQYEADGTVAGQKLPEGLKKWQVLNEPLFTPSTKADVGNDENITVQRYLESMDEVGLDAINNCRRAYLAAYEYARNRGILILDTKFEAGFNPFCLADEVVTPDSSRFTTVEDYELAMVDDRDPIFYDKEPVRIWGREVETWCDDGVGGKIVGINKLKPETDEHRIFVANGLHDNDKLKVAVTEASARYLKIFEMLVGIPLDEYQQTHMGVRS